MARIELPEWINEDTVERAYSRAMEAQKQHDDHYADAGLRAAIARDPRLLLSLEHGAEVLTAMMERQRGRTMRDHSTPYGHRVELTEVGLWRNAYEQVDKGAEYIHLYPYKWIIACAAELAGLRP
jgi:hypothetical protein